MAVFVAVEHRPSVLKRADLAGAEQVEEIDPAQHAFAFEPLKQLGQRRAAGERFGAGVEPAGAAEGRLRKVATRMLTRQP